MSTAIRALPRRTCPTSFDPKTPDHIREMAQAEVISADTVVIAQSPSVMPHRSEMVSVLSNAMGCMVNVKATTTERLGFAGRGEGIAAIATVLLVNAER